jgi:hypothetical protein
MGGIQNVPVSATSEAPEAEDSQDGDEGEDLLERTSSTTSPPPALSEDFVIDKKRKSVEEFASSSTSAHETVAGETLGLDDEQNFSTPWTHEYFANSIVILYLLSSFRLMLNPLPFVCFVATTRTQRGMLPLLLLPRLWLPVNLLCKRLSRS